MVPQEQGLYLGEDGTLTHVYWYYDPDAEKGSYLTTDVTRDALAWLAQPVCFHGDVRLRHIFQLLEANPGLLEVFRRNWAAELLQEAQTSERRPYTGEYSAEGIEYLEIYYAMEADSDGEVYGLNRLSFHGVGFELQEDQMEDGYKVWDKGQRIHWAVEMTPLGQLLELPLRLNTSLHLTNSLGSNILSEEAVSLFKSLNLRHCGTTLGQVIESVLWELSFFGGPTERDQKVAEFAAAIEDYRTGKN